jgi:hypothetical protein
MGPHGRKLASLSGKVHKPVSCHFGGIQFHFPLVASWLAEEDGNRKSIKDSFGLKHGDSFCIIGKQWVKNE